MKKIFVILIAFMVVGLVACSDAKNPPKIPTISEFQEGLNENVCLERLGLYYYQNNVAVSVTEDNLNIDKNKPIVIFTHGMLEGQGYKLIYNFKERQPWTDAGYNVFVFRWSQFADDGDPVSIEKKEWSGGEAMKFAYEDSSGKKQVETENIPEYSLAEIFGIYYNETMIKYDLRAPEIRLLGHSMGGQLSMAISSYIKTMVDKGAINKRYMLSRVTMLDPFIATVKNKTPVRWLDKEMESSAEMIIEILEEFQTEGIPVEYIHSGLADFLMLDKTLREKLQKSTIFLKVDSSYLEGGFVDVKGRMHQVAVDWYNESYDYVLYDKSTNNKTYAIAASTPTNYVIALYGSMMLMEENKTEARGDDIIFSTELKKNIINGYVFYDENKNGLNDDSYANKRSKVRIDLYCDGKKIDTTYSSNGGYYKFEIGEEYANKELYIKAPRIKPSIIGVGEGYLAYTENGINSKKESERFVFTKDYFQIKVINIGTV